MRARRKEANPFRPNPYVTLKHKAKGSGVTDLYVRLEDFKPNLSYESVMGTSRKSLQTSSRKKLEFTSSPGGNVNHPALSARGTRKEELEFLENLLSRQKRGANNEEEEISDEMSWQRRGFPSLRTKINERRELQQRTVPHLKPLKHRNVSAICDVAILSNFPTSQEYASNALAAFCCIKEDREFFLSAGGVQFTIDLLLKCKSSKGKSEACDALAQLLKNEGACKQFVKWKGTDSRTGEEFSSGLDLIFRMRGSKNAQLQRAGIEVCNVVLLSDALKHSERISPEFLRGLCSYCLAGDLKACTRAAQTLVSIFNRVLDTGIRWKVESLQPILELFKSFDMQPAVRTLVLRAMTVITKEGDTLCNLLSKIGCIKTLALQLSSRHNEGVPIDEDDINYLRSITQICETDQKRVEDVLIIGAVPRIISVFKEHLAPYDVQLSVELEVQRKCIRLFEKLASRPNTRSEFFDSGIVKLIIDILELENCSCKHLLHHMLVDISQDSQVQEKWSRMGAADIPRLIRHIKIENLELQTDVLETCELICSSANVVHQLRTTPIMEYLIDLLDAACKHESRSYMQQILAVGTRFLLAFSRQEEGLKHMQLWNVIPRIDPNMQKARGILYENQDKEKIWRFYDELLSTAT